MCKIVDTHLHQSCSSRTFPWESFCACISWKVLSAVQGPGVTLSSPRHTPLEHWLHWPCPTLHLEEGGDPVLTSRTQGLDKYKSGHSKFFQEGEYLLITNTKMAYVGAGEDGSLDDVFATQAWGPQFESQHPHTSQAWQHMCILVWGRHRQVTPWSSLVTQSSQSSHVEA